MSKEITITKETAGLVMQALRNEARALRRQASRPHNQGPDNSGTRTVLRAKAETLGQEAHSIEMQLRGERVAS